MSKIPSAAEVEQEVNNFLFNKYGNQVKIMGTQFGSNIPTSGPVAQEEEPEIQFDMKPEDLHDYLDTFVIKQDRAKEILATKICTHFNRIQYYTRKYKGKLGDAGRIKSNIILMGPTGSGKTYMIKLIAQKLGVPFVKGDATKFTETGYVGGDVEELVRSLVKEADGDIKKARYGIIYIDEIDKIASSNGSIGPDVSRTGVQRNLLKLMEETEVDLMDPRDPMAMMQLMLKMQQTGEMPEQTINTKDILFVVSGAFSGLEDIISRRLTKKGLGFGSSLKEKEDVSKTVKKVKPEDLVSYGFESEFIGRLPVTAVATELETEDLYKILKNQYSSVVMDKKQDFKSYGIDIRFTDEALMTLAEQARDEKTGARALVSVVERALMSFERHLPSTAVDKFTVTKELVECPTEFLQAIKEDNSHPSRNELFYEVDQAEQTELKEELLNRQNGLQKIHGSVLDEWQIDAVVKASIYYGINAETLYKEVINISNEIDKFESDYEEQFGIKIIFDQGARKEISERILEGKEDTLEVYKKEFQDYHHGLKLIVERTGKTELVISADAVEDLEEYLNKLIQSNYRASS